MDTTQENHTAEDLKYKGKATKDHLTTKIGYSFVAISIVIYLIYTVAIL